MKLEPKQLEIGNKYYVINYDNDEVVEAIFREHSLSYNGNKIEFDFRHSPRVDEDGDKIYCDIYTRLVDDKLMEDVGDRDNETLIEFPVFSTLNEAELEKNKYILESHYAVRKLVIKELEEIDEKIRGILD